MKYQFLKYILIIPLFFLIIVQFKFIYIGLNYIIFRNDEYACKNYREYSSGQMSEEENIFYKENIFYPRYVNSNNLDTVIKYFDKIDSMYISYQLRKSRD